MIWSKVIPWAGYPLALALFWFWLEGRENLAKEIERCNTDKAIAAAEASESARKALQASLDRRIKQLEIEAQNEREARQLAEMARAEAEAKPPITRTIVREIDANDETSCLNATVPAAVINSLRD